jgi:hypothetical protein
MCGDVYRPEEVVDVSLTEGAAKNSAWCAERAEEIKLYVTECEMRTTVRSCGSRFLSSR